LLTLSATPFEFGLVVALEFFALCIDAFEEVANALW
jgi:hypothetical protein